MEVLWSQLSVVEVEVEVEGPAIWPRHTACAATTPCMSPQRTSWVPE
jgi:hypothetical protein